MSRGSALGLGNTIPGPYTQIPNLFNARRSADRSSFVVAHSGTRDGSLSNVPLGQRTSVYETTGGKIPDKNFTNMADQVERVMGNCRPGIQDLAPAYGPPAAPNIYKSYPVRAQFENRRKWNESGVDSVNNNNNNFQNGDEGPGGGGGLPGGGGGLPGGGGGLPGGGLKQFQPPPPKQQPTLLGCGIISSGEDQYAHRMTYLNRWFNEDDGEILIQPPRTMQSKYIGSYSDELFKTPIDNTENKISTGIMTNPYTGETYETFENAMPPPNADKYIPADRFEMANPRLIQMAGGINTHAPLPKKKEVCLDVPGTDFGPNVWGDQLFSEERRRRMIEIANRDLWNNRNGDMSTAAAVAKEKPAGFVGVQAMYRSLPYLPPTQTLDNKGYLPVSDYNQNQPESTVIKSEVFVTKPDLTTCAYQQPAGPLNDQEVEYVVGQYENRPTWRGGNDTYYAGVPFLHTNETVGPQQSQNKSTLKEFMEQKFEPSNITNAALESGSNPYVVQQFENKSTRKEFMEQTFSGSNMYNQVVQSGGGGHVVTQYENRPTLKESMEQTYQPSNVTVATLESGQNPYVVSQYENRSTLKESMEQTYQPSNVTTATLESGQNPYVISQFENRPTRKEFMEGTYQPSNVTTAVLESGQNPYVISQFENRPTRKEFMEGTYQPSNVTTAILETGSNPYVLTQFENRPTLREFMETEFPVNIVDPSRPENGYVVMQTENKKTLKELMQQTFDMSNFADERTGAYIDFQGPLAEVRRAYYEKMPGVARPAHFSDGVGGDYIGTGLITSKQNRGQDATNWVEPSLVPQDAGDTNSRWIGQYDRDTKREFVQNIPMSDLAPSFQSAAPRMLGALSAKCNMDLRQIDDEFSWAYGFEPQFAEVITG
jgi:hypothetical protein